MSKLRFRISMSLAGFVAGPDQSVKNPLGVGGMRLHLWAFPLKAWRRDRGRRGRHGSPRYRWTPAYAGVTLRERHRPSPSTSFRRRPESRAAIASSAVLDLGFRRGDAQGAASPIPFRVIPAQAGIHRPPGCVVERWGDDARWAASGGV